MSDIVEQLRARCESWETADGEPMTDGTDAVLDRKAADEIERLRKLGDDMAYWYENLGPSMTMRDAVEAWKEARRG